MATEGQKPQSAQLAANLARIEALTQRLLAALARRRTADANLQMPGQEFFLKAGAAFWNEALQNPAKLIETQAALWGKVLENYLAAGQALAAGAPPPLEDKPHDRRFANPLWSTHPWFRLIRQQYEVQAEALHAQVAALTDLDPEARQRLEFFTRQYIDMLAPTNFLATNPEALERAVATEGESLARGLENLVADLEANEGDLLVTLADRDAFRPGKNLATSEGAVVFRNRLMELIQYAPRSGQVHAIPLVIFPPWINKFYVLDLSEQKSLVRWITEQGFTLFVLSWKNPDASYRDVGLGDYVTEGYVAAIDAIRTITGAAQVNAVGYCIAGTTLALTLALMAKRGDTSINSATFLTTLTDFADPGEVGVFLDDDFVDGIERESEKRGVLDRYFMARTFSYLRANDLVYAPAIRSYMLGERPPAFDLLYWNGDGTNLPQRMAMEYLRGLCQSDEFAQGGFSILGQKVTLGDIALPIAAVACETDHIAPWRSSYAGIRRMGSADKTFILAQSGHIAGIVNPPAKGKYGHHAGPAPGLEAEAWLKAAKFHEGSWWPRWGAWLAARSGPMIPAPELGGNGYEILGPAPGEYVLETPTI